MFEFLPIIAIEKIVKNLDEKSKKNLNEAAIGNKVLSSKLQELKYNVCPFCLLKKLSNPHSLLKTIDAEAIFDHHDAFSCFLIKDQNLFDIKSFDGFFKLIKVNDKISGTYLDDNDNEYNFDQVLNEKSLIKAWHSIIRQQEHFDDQQFNEHLLLHFICNKAITKNSPWTITKMNNTISELANRSQYCIDPKIYTNHNFLKFGSLESQLNFLVSVKYLWKDDIIAHDIESFTLSLAKNLINKTLKSLTDICFLSPPTNLFYFAKHFSMLKLVFT